MGCIDEIMSLFESKGRESYLGEPVSQAEHALQAAGLAQEAGARAPLVAAALLHDIGHLIQAAANQETSSEGRLRSLDKPSTFNFQPSTFVDRRHEEAGAAWLARWFGPEITGPIRLHVPAKRYLCRTDSSYTSGLSGASLRSLEIQGGPMTVAEVEAFERNPYYASAVQLRRWDDQAKVPGATVASVESYREILRSCLNLD